jgi:molybdopterin/thiamine biosynthesis adenylyltransferase
VVEHLRRLNRDIEVEAHNMRVGDACSLLDVLRDADLVINGIDTPSLVAFRWVNSACVHLEKPMLLGGIDNGRVLLQTFLPHSHGCYDCYLINLLRQHPDTEASIRALYGQVFRQRNTAMAPHVAFYSGFLSNEAAKLLAGHAEPLPPSTTVELDTQTMQLRHIDPWPRYEECPTCGAQKHERTGIEPVDLEELIEIAKSGMVQR